MKRVLSILLCIGLLLSAATALGETEVPFLESSLYTSLVRIVETGFDKDETNYTYSYNEDLKVWIVKITLPAGVALGISTKSSSVLDLWPSLRSSILDLSEAMKDLLDDGGYKDISVCFMFMSDLDEDSCLLSAFNDFILYDVLAEDEEEK